MLLILTVLPQLASANDLGMLGAVYPIAEKDALTEFQERAGAVDWPKVFEKKKWEKKIKDYKAPDMVKLPPARENRTRLVDMTWSSEFDVPDGKGGVLYPKGYTFNPLEYLFLPQTLVFIDGTDREQVLWLKNSPYQGDLKTVLLLVDGSYFDMSKELKRPAFYANRKIVERLDIRAVPSVAVQNGKVMQVREYRLNKGEK